MVFSPLERAALLAAERAYRAFVGTTGLETEGGTELLDGLEEKLQMGEALDAVDRLLLQESLEYITRLWNETALLPD